MEIPILTLNKKLTKVSFADGNGRVGRMLMFKECLKNNICPFIALDSDKPYYMRGLREYTTDKAFLIDTIKNEQDIYSQVCNELLDFDLRKSKNIDLDRQ